MYIIIHKYQRWPVNVERPQSKYLKICLKTNKSNIKIMVCWSKSDPVGFHRSGKSYMYTSCWGRDRQVSSV